MTLPTLTRSECIVLGKKPKTPLIPAGIYTLRYCDTDAKIAQAVSTASAINLTWITTTTAFTDRLLLAATDVPHRKGMSIGARKDRLFAMQPPSRAESVPTLTGLFRNVVGASGTYSWLPTTQLIEVLTDPAVSQDEVLIAVSVNVSMKLLTLVRGTGQYLVVPFDAFKPSGEGIVPDFATPTLADYGHTLALGSYEAAADAILYEFDAEYRRKIRKQEQARDPSLGACLRRLRLQKKLNQSDFGDVPSKTIARIERGEVIRPQAATLATISKVLGVRPDEIKDY